MCSVFASEFEDGGAGVGSEAESEFLEAIQERFHFADEPALLGFD